MPWNKDGSRKKPSTYKQDIDPTMDPTLNPEVDPTTATDPYGLDIVDPRSPYTMKGHAQPGPFQRKSPLKQNPKGVIFDPTQSGDKTWISQDMYTGMEGTSQEWRDAHPISSKLYAGMDKSQRMYWQTEDTPESPYIPKLAQHLVGGAAGVIGMGANVIENVAGNIGRMLKWKSTKTGEVIGSEAHRIKKGYTPLIPTKEENIRE